MNGTKRLPTQNISVTYMSPETQNEFIEILGNKVRQEIISRVQ